MKAIQPNENSLHRFTQSNTHETPQHSLMETIQKLFKQYMNQLLLGCGAKECREVLCHTGRLNTSEKPVRKFTPRAAREVALAVCSGQNPREHVCSYYRDNGLKADAPHLGTPHDPSSLMQLLSDTPSIVGFEQSNIGNELEQNQITSQDQVSEMLEVAGRVPPLSGKGYLSNSQLAVGLFSCFEFLLSKIPFQQIAPSLMSDPAFANFEPSYSSVHSKMPVDEKGALWQPIVDILHTESYLRLLERMMLVVARRRALERALSLLDDRESPNHFSSPNRNVENLLAKNFMAMDDPNKIAIAILWLKKLFANIWDSKPRIKISGSCFGVLETLKSFYLHSKLTSGRLLPETFQMPVITSRLSVLELSCTFAESLDTANAPHILSWSFLFLPEELSSFFRSINHLTMRDAHAEVEKTMQLSRQGESRLSEENNAQIEHAQQHYLLLNVSRQYVLRDAFDQLWQRRKVELRRPLRVRLGEADELEIGHDLGGVQIEFFNLVCKEAFAEEAGMFTTDPTTGFSYIRAGSLQPLYMFELFGVVMGLALYNGITLPISLPWAFYFRCLEQPGTLRLRRVYPRDIQDGWPIVAKSLQQILDDDIEGLEFTFPLEANGIRLTVLPPGFPDGEITDRKEMNLVSAVPVQAGLTAGEMDLQSGSSEWPGWRLLKADPGQAPEEVTPGNKEAYVEQYIHFLLYQSVAPQFDALLKGFNSANFFQNRTLAVFTPEQLKSHVEGTSQLDISDLKEATRYDGYDRKSKYITSFWRIVTAWPEPKQKQLLKFVTAAERIPISGAKNLTFIIKKSTPDSMDSLPTSSTCFGTLMLPRYPTAEVLAAKLNLALKYGTEGFGTG